MTDFVLPTQAAVDALTPASFTLTDSDVGYLTKEVGSVVKLLVDQMSSSELVHIRSVRTATGKTEKFIIDNIADWSAGPKVVTTDIFTQTLMDTTNFFGYTGNDDKIYKNQLPVPVVGTNADGDPISLTTTVNGTATVVDLTTDPDARSRSQIASHNSPLGTLNLMQNSSGTALGEEADEFEPDLILCMLNPVATAYPNWDSFGHVNHLTSAFNNLPINGVMMINHVEFDRINDALWLVLDSQVAAGHTYEATWIVSEAGGLADVGCIKRTG